LTSGIKIYVAVRSVARLVSDHLRLFPSMRSGVGDRIFEMRPDPTAPERAFYRGRWRAGFLRESRPAAEMLALLTIGIGAKLRVRALDEGWTRLFVSKFIRFLPLIAEATPACKLGGMAASDSFLQPDRKLQDVNAVSAFNTMFIVLVSQGKSRKSSEKCW
jgi:hypothetical protein